VGLVNFYHFCPCRRAFHLDLQTADQFVHRVSVGNVYNKSGGASLGVQMQLDLPGNKYEGRDLGGLIF
jgi:hypothetical protein